MDSARSSGAAVAGLSIQRKYSILHTPYSIRLRVIDCLPARYKLQVTSYEK